MQFGFHRTVFYARDGFHQTTFRNTPFIYSVINNYLYYFYWSITYTSYTLLFLIDLSAYTRLNRRPVFIKLSIISIDLRIP